MKKLFTLYICIFATLIFVSCDTMQETASTNTLKENTNEIITSDNKNSFKNETFESLLSRIENLEKEIDSLKEALQAETHTINNHDAIFNALDNDNGDNILLSMENEDGYLNAVHIKAPKGENLSYEFYLLTGFEVDGVPIFNCLIKPQIDTSDNPEKIDIETEKFSLYKLMTSKLKYDETSVMLIIIIDNNGEEYSQFIPSARFMGDI